MELLRAKRGKEPILIASGSDGNESRRRKQKVTNYVKRVSLAPSRRKKSKTPKRIKNTEKN